MGKVAYRIKHGRYEDIFDGTHEHIIEPDLWERCQRIAEQRKSASRSAQSVYRVYLLSGLATCDVCLRSLRCQSTKSGSYYREMSAHRGYSDCPHQQTGVRTEAVDKQIHTIIEGINLPPDWLDEISEKAGDEEELIRVTQERDRLEAERRRLKVMRIQGDFEDDIDIYNQKLNGIRRELDNLPTPDQLASLRSTVNAIVSIKELWRDADPADQRDLIRLMFREVRIDVKSGRVTLLRPVAIMIPILRQCSMLFECEFGEFVPVWEEAQAEEISPLKAIPTGGTTSDKVGLLLPYTCSDPLLPNEKTRIAPALSKALMMCKDAGHEPQRVTHVIFPGDIPLPADLRRWDTAYSETLSFNELQNQSSNTISVLAIRYPFFGNRKSNNFDPMVWFPKALDLLVPKGALWLCAVAPLDMPTN